MQTRNNRAEEQRIGHACVGKYMMDIYVCVYLCFIRGHSRRYECTDMQICIDNVGWCR